MANQLQDPSIYGNPETGDEQGYPNPDLGPGHNRPSGRTSDPRGEGAANNSSDPRGEGPDSPTSSAGWDGNDEESGGLDKPGLRGAEEAGGASEGAAAYGTGEEDAGGFNQADPDELRDSEENGDYGFARGFENDQRGRGQQAKKGNAQSFLRKNRSKLLLGGGFLTGGVGGVAVVFLLMLPLKIESIVNNLESRFFSAPQSAVSDMTQNLLKDYLIYWVIPDYKAGHCFTTVDRHCKVTVYSTKGGPVVNLYRAWAHERLETKLAETYHIELQYKPVSKTWYIKAPGLSGQGDNIGADGQGLEHEFTRVDRGVFHATVRNAVSDLTWYKKLLVRYKIGRLLSVKFGNKRYLFFNGTRQLIHGKITDFKQGAKVAITQRVITPYNQALGIAIECLLTECDPTVTQSTDPASAPEQNGFPENPETDTKVRQTLVDLASKYGVTDLTDVLATYKEIADKGFQKYLITKGLTPIIGEANASTAADKIPIIGWINLAAQLINSANNAGPKIKKLAYVTVGGAAAVNMWVLYRTQADEIHTGHDNAAEVGAMVSSLGAGNSGSPNDPELGGTASAEQTPLYSAMFDSGSGSSTTASLLSGILPAKAYAATKNPNAAFSSYICSDGKPVPASQLVCNEEILGGGNAIANSVHSFLSNTPVVGAITSMAHAWVSVFGSVFGFVGGILGSAMSVAAAPINATCDLLGTNAPDPANLYCAARDEVKKTAPVIIKAVATALIPDPIGTNMSGGRTFDMVAGGADVSGNTYAQVGLGAKKVSAGTSAAIFQKQQDEAKQEFAQRPLFARMFDTGSQYSLVSSLAMATPSSLQTSAESSFASLLSNPFGALGNSFGSIFSGKAAAAGPSKDPFGVPQYAYPSMPANPGTYWEHHCSDNPAQAYESDADWNAPPGTPGRIGNWDQQASSTVDPENGMPENKTTNPCLLIKATTGVDGGLFDTSLLTQDDLADVNPGGTGTTSSSTSSGCGGSGKYSALVSSGASFAGTDQGIDFVPSGSGGFDICAPAPGTITLADQTGHHFNRTSGQAEIIEKLDQPPNAPSSSQYIYYAEIIKINSGIQVGNTVKKGDIIGHSDQSPGIEVGWAPDPTHGFMCTITGGATPCGQSFGNWVQGL